MANKLVERLSNTKTRALLLFIIFVALVIVVVVLFFTGKSTPLQTEQSRAASIPSITSVPGQVTTERYQELQIEANKRRAQEAKKLGTSAVATIIGSTDKDGLSKKETFGIEDKFLKQGECKCPPQGTTPGVIPELDAALAQKLISQIEADPSQALKLFQQNPGLARALCNKNPELALKTIENNKEAAKIMLKECPSMAKLLAEKNPALFKELMLENPELAKSLAVAYPDVFKKFMKDDPEFAKRLAQTNPELVKTLLKNDSDFAAEMGRQNPDMVKDLMRGDPDFAAALAKSNPTLVKELMKNDPKFAAQMAELNPNMVKTLMRDDLEFAKIMAKNNPDMVDTLMKNDPAFAKELLEKNPEIRAILEANHSKMPGLSDKERIAAIEAEGQRRLAEQAQSAKQVQLSELQQKQLAALLSGMESQANNELKGWDEASTQAYVAGDWAKAEEKKDDKMITVVEGGGPEGPSGPKGGVLMKAGAIYFAVLDTSVNTDEPGPILATIVDGPFKGGKLIGGLQPFPPAEGTRPEKISLNFTTLSHPDFPNSISIQGVAIDPDTARTAMATDVDHHYLMRYGATFAAAFMTGYAKVITSMGTTTTTALNGLNTQTMTPQLSTKKQLYASLGEVGKQAGELIKPFANAPNTITVDAGTGFGLLILSDVSGS